jgi:PAS domain-containing protein
LNYSKEQEHLVRELRRMEMEMKENEEVKQLFIGRLKLLTENAGMFSDVFDSLPFPMALFKKGGELVMANRALIDKTGGTADDFLGGKMNLLSRMTDENFSVLEATEDTFLGKTTLLRKLVCPLTMFCRDESRTVSNAYKNAVFFPVANVQGHITTGAVMLMK